MVYRHDKQLGMLKEHSNYSSVLPTCQVVFQPKTILSGLWSIAYSFQFCLTLVGIVLPTHPLCLPH